MSFTNENNLIENEECTIFYSGDLYQKKSDRVFIVYGFGNNWEHTSEKEMLKQENGFLAKIRMLQYNNIHFCFRNSNYEWDNNNSANYTLPILEADKNTSPKTNTENVKTESNDKNELLNNILEESNVELDYVQEFDIDNLIEEILSPLLEETLYSFDESEVPETKVNESVTTLLNEELDTSKDQTFEISDDLKTFTEPSTTSIPSSEFSMTTLIEDLKKDIIEAGSFLTSNDEDIPSTSNVEIISNTVKEETTSFENIEETSNNTNITENLSTMLNDTTVSISSSIVDEILEDITQMFENMDFNTDIVEEIIENVSDTTEQTTDSVDTNTILENTEEQNDTNNDDDDDSNSNITTLNISDNNNSLDDDITEDIDIDNTDIEETEEDASLDSNSEIDSEESVAACTALTVRNEDRFVICSRKLTKFYMIRKKIKLALYKIFFAIPRMIKREFNTNKNQD